ncbi:MAG: c-type cytochrome [Anaerolineales bacterium]
MYLFRWNTVVFLVILTAGLFFPWTLSQGPGGRRGVAFSKPATNLKILEVDDPEDLRPIMRNFSRSLGVNCRFCHDPQDWAKDVPHKEAARRMIEMVNEINTEVFTWERAPRATCHMCHNGNVYPKFDPPSED